MFYNKRQIFMNTGTINSRVVKIMEILAANRNVKTNLLAEMLDVSRATLRKDLDNLEKRGMICRRHGFVSLDAADNTGRRMAVSHSIKRRIAKAAVQIVEEDETIMIESGSCCALFAEELSLSGKNVTIITNSVFIANHVSKMQNIKIILLGGCLQPESQVLVGQTTENCSRQFFTDKFFLGTNGFIHDYGFTGRDCLRAETSTELAKCAKKTFVLTEASKFKQRGAYNLMPFDKLAGIFTDDGIPKEAEASLIKNNVKLHKVPSIEEKTRWRQFPGHPPILYKEKE
jgi:DeoR/GlpR family transcriptional regulator of sugar metabolism